MSDWAWLGLLAYLHIGFMLLAAISVVDKGGVYDSLEWLLSGVFVWTWPAYGLLIIAVSRWRKWRRAQRAREYVQTRKWRA